LKRKLGNIYIGDSFEGKAIYARDLNAQGAMTALLKDAIKPNLVQTIEGNPAIIHGGPFANIAQGTNSLIATKMGLSLSDYVVTEAGFASELGAEKFLNIKSQYGNLNPNASILVVTLRALKHHGGVKNPNLAAPNSKAVKEGLKNMAKHIENLSLFNLKPVVAINKFSDDTDEEIKVITDYCKANNVRVAVAEVWAEGGKGALELAEQVLLSIEERVGDFKPLYDFSESIESKIEKIATQLYGASKVEYTVAAQNTIKRIGELGLSNLPVCIAKTQNSLSDDPYKTNRPKGFTVKIRDIEMNSGAGFIIPIAGTIMRMPGLPSRPSAEKIDIDDDGVISGLF
jgi:formate--tetrahydrofolate ligase